jgi:hypothetical protein
VRRLTLRKFGSGVALLALTLLPACRELSSRSETPVESEPTAAHEIPATDQPAGSSLDSISQEQSLRPKHAGELDELTGLPRYLLQVVIVGCTTPSGDMHLDYQLEAVGWIAHTCGCTRMRRDPRMDGLRFQPGC